jgi:PAS domain S-box-containing protein
VYRRACTREPSNVCGKDSTTAIINSNPRMTDGRTNRNRNVGTRARLMRSLLVALGLAWFYWFAEAASHALILRQGSFTEELFTSDLHEAWHRFSVAALLLVSTLLVQSLLNKRKSVEEGLRASERMFRTLAEASLSGIFIFQDLRFRYVNPSMARLFGYEPDELINKLGPMELTLPQDHASSKEYIETQLSANASLRTHSFRGVRRDGSLIDCEAIANKILYDGRPAIIGTLLDVTERKRTERWIRGLNSLKEHLLAAGGLEKKLHLITDAVVNVFCADFARIWIVEPGDRCNSGCVHAAIMTGPHVCRHKGKCLHLMASSGRYTHIDGQTHRRLPFGCYKIGQVAAGEDPKFLTNDVTQDPRVHDRAWAKKLGLVSFVGYKLSSSAGEPIGVLALFSKHEILPDEDALLEAVANTTAQVVQTVTAEMSALQKTRQLEELVETARQLTSSLDTREVLTRIGVEAKEILRAYGCAIYLLEPDGRTLKPVVAIEPPYEKEILATPLDVDASFTGQAVKAGRGLIFNESVDNPTGQHIPGTEEHEDENVIVTPFIVEGRVVGAMCLSRLATRFETEDLALAETFAAYASTALKNARTYNELNQEMERTRQAEEALRESEERFRRVFNRVFDACVMIDEDQRIVITNDAASDLLGYTKEELSALAVRDIHPPEEMEKISRAIHRVFLHGTDYMGETAVLNKRGESIPVEGGGAVVRTAGRTYILGSFRDISESKKAKEALAQKADELALANAQLERANMELMELDRMKSDFLSSVSHELRTPLAAVRAYAETLVHYDSIPTEKRDSFMNIIIEQSERLSVVIEDLLDLSRVEAGKLRLSPVPLKMKEAVEPALHSVMPIAEKKGIDVQVNIPRELGFVLADEQRLVQILVNLLNNAVKFTEANGNIQLSSREVADRTGSNVAEGERPGYVCITVSDNGEGIPSHELSRVFDKFRQVGDSSKGRPGGTGLGLAICRELVENMRGRIWVESTEGEGSDFHFTLPLAGEITTADAGEPVTHGQPKDDPAGP